MKQVILFGDSIRLGYQDTVRELLLDSAEVWSPLENTGHTVHLLTNLHGYLRDQRPDLIHLNAGLHDLKTVVFGGRENLIPIDHYRHHLRTILRTLRQKTEAKLVFATTTPVRDSYAHTAHILAGDFDRFDADVVAYNAVAREVCMEQGVPLNDLYAVARTASLSRIQADDGVHFTPDGYRLLATAVARAIGENL